MTQSFFNHPILNSPYPVRALGTGRAKSSRTVVDWWNFRGRSRFASTNVLVPAQMAVLIQVSARVISSLIHTAPFGLNECDSGSLSEKLT